MLQVKNKRNNYIEIIFPHWHRLEYTKINNTPSTTNRVQHTIFCIEKEVPVTMYFSSRKQRTKPFMPVTVKTINTYCI